MVFVLLIVVVILAGANLYSALFEPGALGFFDASAVDCLTLLCLICLSYYLVEKNNKKMKQKDVLQSLIATIINSLESSKYYDIQSIDHATLLTNKRHLSNSLNNLDTYSDKFGYKESMKSVLKYFSEYEDTISDNINDINCLAGKKAELKKQIDQISRILFEISMELYK